MILTMPMSFSEINFEITCVCFGEVAEGPTRCGALRAGGQTEGRAARRALREGHAVTGSK